MEKGDITRQKILDIARNEFYTKGYNAVKMKDITDRLGVQPCWISYYFKNKETLIEHIVSVFYNDSLNNTLDEQYPGIVNPLLRHLVTVLMSYRVFFSDLNNLRFRQELAYKEIQVQKIREYLTNVISNTVHYYQLNVTYEKMIFIGTIRTAAVNSAILTKLDEFEKDNEEFDQQAMMIESIMPFLLGIDHEEICKLSDSAIQIARVIDISGIEYLRLLN